MPEANCSAPPLVERQITYLVIPFAYLMPYETAVQTLASATKAGSNTCLWRLKNDSKQQLFQHVDHLIDCSPGQNEAIGKRLVLEPAGKSAHWLPNNTKELVTFTPAGESYAFSIGEIVVYLFETQVGFMVYEIRYPSGTAVDDLISCNYYLKKISQYRHKIHRKPRPKQPEKVRQTLCLGETTLNLLSEIKVETFFENAKGLPRRALVYSGIVLDKSVWGRPDTEYENLLKNYLFLMRRSFKKTYLPAESEFNLTDNPEVLQTFQNSYWGISLEGAAQVSHLVENEKTNQFFLENHINNVKRTYFYLYILVLHQYFALQYFSILASRLPFRSEDHFQKINPSAKDRPSVESLKNRMVLFKLRSSFKQVSHITHQANLYVLMRTAFRIEELMEELQLELDAITALIDMEDNDRRNRNQNAIMIASFFFVIISVLADGWSVSENIDKGLSFKQYWGYISFGILIALLLFGGLWVTVYLFKNRFRK
ncbi:hypothetical protein ACFO25_03190 [Paenactinomyces guangxiensis]|uniref:Uncharacterized protein n=1 Tax=Paenactinomyces guangxiensis TaxID=1490290 RepID=A0A7W1WTB5_9BACL|nr:hypothetical protein [Paenactinomyces guangxiensis]MBA4495685.1 hypothetical protein [Paenactinomyces guangxiensis]MBH8592673.1 hypothetical protein [Paenactinomyces guangxiensis]